MTLFTASIHTAIVQSFFAALDVPRGWRSTPAEVSTSPHPSPASEASSALRPRSKQRSASLGRIWLASVSHRAGLRYWPRPRPCSTYRGISKALLFCPEDDSEVLTAILQT